MKTIVADVSLAKSSSENPDSSELKNLILNVPEDEWANGTGQSTFTCFENNHTKSKISLYGSNGFGFLLQYEEFSPDKSLSFLTEGVHTGETAYTYSGGDSYLCYREYLVAKETIWKAIEYFLETGEKLKGLNWTTDYKVPDDF